MRDYAAMLNGTAIHRDPAAKFTFYSELLPFWSRGQSLVIYQHTNMDQTAALQIAERVGELAMRLPSATLDTVYYPSGSGRIFFIAAQPHQSAAFPQAYELSIEIWQPCAGVATRASALDE